MKRKLFEVFKSPHGERIWYVQLPKGMLDFRTKRAATAFADKMKALHISKTDGPLTPGPLRDSVRVLKIK